MLKWIGVVLIATVAIAMQACAPKSQEDCGFVQNVYGERISWKGEVPVVMKLHTSVPDSYIPAIQAAAKTWNQAAGRELIVIDTVNRDNGPMDPHRDSNNVIYLMNTWEADRASEQARTSVYWVGDAIKEADIRLNAKNFSYYTDVTAMKSNQVSLQSLVLHEMGHVLGLKHKDGQGSVMATFLAANTDRTQVAQTDNTSLKCEY